MILDYDNMIRIPTAYFASMFLRGDIQSEERRLKREFTVTRAGAFVFTWVSLTAFYWLSVPTTKGIHGVPTYGSSAAA